MIPSCRRSHVTSCIPEGPAVSPALPGMSPGSLQVASRVAPHCLGCALDRLAGSSRRGTDGFAIAVSHRADPQLLTIPRVRCDEPVPVGR